ncbi:DUF4124 domain-containing protein [Pseudomonas sp. Gutcm_11s]|uniref:DUF4124 domain-containing protein n=1 Tax=Pseudomonas sp. Gutcm_11s TaxID=3026088 RepID=UPI0023608EC2|nr:DUF4124 domain-containing protein [Pseudomonas sp. Gutcm_11s]MDD0845511.1 DUF4124 domain-containing protein [Pseudomonas sp. Gutcm_11s]
MRRMILACSVLLALSTGATAGQIYKWVDSQGNVHFGSQPPEGQPSAAVNPNVSQPKVAAPPPAVPKSEAKDEKQEKLDREAKDQIAKQDEERKAYCESTRQDLAQMRATSRLRVEENGELRRLTEEERQARIDKAEASIKENCQ